MLAPNWPPGPFDPERQITCRSWSSRFALTVERRAHQRQRAALRRLAPNSSGRSILLSAKSGAIATSSNPPCPPFATGGTPSISTTDAVRCAQLQPPGFLGHQQPPVGQKRHRKRLVEIADLA